MNVLPAFVHNGTTKYDLHFFSMMINDVRIPHLEIRAISVSKECWVLWDSFFSQIENLNKPSESENVS